MREYSLAVLPRHGKILIDVCLTYSQCAFPMAFLTHRAPFSQGFGEQDTRPGTLVTMLFSYFKQKFKKLSAKSRVLTFSSRGEEDQA